MPAAFNALAALQDVNHTANGDAPLRPDPSNPGRFIFGDARARYNIETYGALTSDPALGAADVSHGVGNWNAWVTARALAKANDGIVHMGPGRFYFAQDVADSLPGQFLWTPDGAGENIYIEGSGRALTTVQLGASVPAVFGPGPITQDVTWGDIYIGGFTADCNNLTPSAGTTNSGRKLCYIANMQAGFFTGFESLTIEEVDSINCGTYTQNRTAVWINPQGTVGDLTPKELGPVRIRNCHFGRDGTLGGKNGVIVSCNAAGNRLPSNVWQMTQICGVVLPEIILENIEWEAGQIPSIAANGTVGSGIQLGEDAICERVRIDNCHVSGSCDVGIEFGASLDVTCTNSSATDCNDAGFYWANLGGKVDVDQQHVLIEDCKVYRNNVPSMQGIVTTAQRGYALGHLTVRGFEFISTCPTIATTAQAMLLGPNQTITIEDFKAMVKGWTFTGAVGAVSYAYAMISHPTGAPREVLNWKNLYCQFDGIGNDGGQNSTFIQGTVLSFQALQGAELNIDAVTWRSNITVQGVKNLGRRMRGANLNGNSTVNENWASSGYFSKGWGFRAGTAGAVTQDNANSQLLVAAGSTTQEQRYTWIEYEGDFHSGHIGQVVDCDYYHKHAPDASFGAGYKLGAIAKESDDGTQYVEAYDYDDGTNTYLCIDKVVSGVRTSLLGTIGTTNNGFTISAIVTPGANSSDRGIIQASRLTTPNNYFVRIRCVGNTIQADHFNAAPAVNTNGTRTAIINLQGDDIEKFGATASGWLGLSWVAMGTAAKITQTHFNQFPSYTGRISRFNPGGIRDLSNTTGNQNYVMSITSPGVNLAQGHRITGKLSVSDSDFTRLGQAGTELVGFDGSIPIIFERNTYLNQPTATNPAVPASGTALLHVDAQAGDYYVSGGTVSSITITRRNGVASPSVGTFLNAQRLNVGDSITITYTVAPTITKIPVP